MTRIERSIYRDLLDLYYDTERPLLADVEKLARRCLVEDKDLSALRNVLEEFFELRDGGYHNARADREIEAYLRMVRGAKVGAAKRWTKPSALPPQMPPNIPAGACLDSPADGPDDAPAMPGAFSPAMRTDCPGLGRGNANHEPVTMNHEPVTIKPRNTVGGAKRRTQLPESFEPNEDGRQKAVSKGLEVDYEIQRFSDFHRGKGSVMADWQAAWRTWVSNARPPAGTPPNGQPAETTYQRSMREKYELLTGRSQQPIDVEATNVIAITLG